MVFQNDILAGAAGAGTGYTIDQSIRFNDNDSAYLSRTSTSADSDRKFASVSMWLKRCNLTSRQIFYSINGAGSSGASNQISMGFENSGTNGDSITYNNGAVNRQSTSVYRDVSGWYHFCQIFDTTQATAANRVKTYINGVLLTDINIGQDFSLNSNTPFGQSSVVHYIGRRDSGFYFDGYMSEVVFTVGQSVAVTDFGETNSDGVWIPKAYTGTYGTNGFYITGEDSADLGADYSGNGNNFTSSGLTSDDQVTDSPTENYATLTPLIVVPSGTISNGNLEYTRGSTASHGSVGSSFALPTTGKWYWEVTAAATGGNNEAIGVANILNNPQLPAAGAEIGSRTGDYIYRSNGVKVSGGASTSYGATFTSGDIIGVAWNSDDGEITFFKNNATQGVAYSGISQQAGKYVAADSQAQTGTTVFNFGQSGFTYTPPTGFSALSTANLTDSTITTSGSFTGNASTDGPFVFLNGVPTAMTINGNSVTFGTDADKLANGFKVRSSSSSYNASGSNTFVISATDASFADNANAQSNP